MYTDTPVQPPVDVSKRYVRITARRNGFVEFDFAIAHPEITVELILPAAAFSEFCRMNGAILLEPEPAH
jgi:phenol hydroxylase P0 protein